MCVNNDQNKIKTLKDDLVHIQGGHSVVILGTRQYIGPLGGCLVSIVNTGMVGMGITTTCRRAQGMWTTDPCTDKITTISKDGAIGWVVIYLYIP